MSIVNGSDMLAAIDGKCFGHCSDTTVNFDSETKTRTFKATAKTPREDALWDETSISKLKCTVSFSGLKAYAEKEASFGAVAGKWKKGMPVPMAFYYRPEEGLDLTGAAKPEPWLAGNFVITKLTVNSPAGEDATYSGEATLTGAPSVFNPELADVEE